MTTTQDQATDDFPSQSDGYRRELFVHCYRMVGSVHDAEDLVQETYLRAWRSYHTFEHRSSMRTWLYRIATNVCLTSLEGKSRRPLPSGLGADSIQPGAPLVSNEEVLWLEPAPDALLTDRDDPADLASAKESVRLAFIAALQHLPARQRAVLVLRDVLMWRAAEVADALELSVAAVNSMLQRARATLADHAPTQDAVVEPPTAEQRELLDRYVAAFWAKDVDALVSMFTHDAVWEMPPFVGWYQGGVSIGRLIDRQCPSGAHDMRMIATAANGQPAFGLYMRGADGVFTPFHLQVVTLVGAAVSHVVAFFDHQLFQTFGLPASLSADSVPGDAVPGDSLAAART